jgi:carboxyl-terminal processing protease
MTNQEQLHKPFYAFLSQPILLGCLGLLLMASTFLAGLGLGFGVGRWSTGGNLWASASGQSPIAAACSENRQTGVQGQLYPQFDLFWEAMDLLYRDYYGQLPQAEDATNSAIRSVLGLLDDPNTSFLTPTEAEFFRSQMQGAFEGIGARVGWDEEANTVVITEPFENQPAWLAGLRRNDLLLAVDGESLVGTDLNEAVQKIRGPKGSTVILTVQRPDGGAPFDITVVRARIEIPTISTDTLGEDRDIAYVRLNSFNENAGQLVREAVRNAMQRTPRGLIFDLRGNSGGLLREAVKVASVFLQDEVVLLERFNDGKTDTYKTVGRAVTGEIPIIVLVNEGSASASEIVAGALQDTGRATLIGATTFGKGSVQLPHTLSNGAIMRVTVARWYTPNDRTIDGVGLTPDLIVETTPEQIEAGDDPQLDAALNYLSAIEARP